MTENSTNKPPVWFWIVSVVALIWNSMGAMTSFGPAYLPDEVLAALPEAEQSLYTDFPAWATAAFAIAVWGGLLGSLALLLRKKWAKPVLLISLIGILVTMTYNLFMSQAMEVYGPGSAILPLMVIIIGIYLVWFSKKSIAKGWIS